jgi:type I restriction enzyme M protein
MNHNGNAIESRLWAAADELRANSKLKSSEYSVPVLTHLPQCDIKFERVRADFFE